MTTVTVDRASMGFLAAWWRYFVFVLGGQTILFLLIPLLVIVSHYGWRAENGSLALEVIADLPHAIVLAIFTAPYTLLLVALILVVLRLLTALGVCRAIMVPAIGFLSAMLSAGPSLYIDSILFGFFSAFSYPRVYVPALLGVGYGVWLVCGSFYRGQSS